MNAYITKFPAWKCFEFSSCFFSFLHLIDLYIIHILRKVAILFPCTGTCQNTEDHSETCFFVFFCAHDQTLYKLFKYPIVSWICILNEATHLCVWHCKNSHTPLNLKSLACQSSLLKLLFACKRIFFVVISSISRFSIKLKIT